MDFKGMIGKELDEVISAIPPQVIVHIGSKSSFFFVGTKKDYDDDIDGISKRFQEIAKMQKRRAEAKVIENAKDITSQEVTIKEFFEKIDNIKKLIKKMEHWMRYIEKYQVPRERVVVDAYERVMQDGIVIIVTGKEEGAYWSYEEYRRDKDEQNHD